MVESLKDIPSSEIVSYASGVVDLSLHSPMKLPFGQFNSRPSGVVEIEIRKDNKLFKGYGEGATLPQPLFTDDSSSTIAEAGRFILENIHQSDNQNLNTIFDQVAEIKFPNQKKYPTARMMVEMALIDAYAKSNDTSVKKMLGIPDHIQSVAYGKSLGEGSKQQILDQALGALRDGASKIKLKVSPESFENVISVIEDLQNIGKFELMVDANGTFDPTDNNHINMLKKIDQAGLLMIEEPVSRVGKFKGLEAVRILRQAVDFKTNICLDDCLVDLDTTRNAIAEKLANVVNIKPGRIGSIIKSIELSSYCQTNGSQIMVGGMLEATPGRCMTVTLAALFASKGSKIPGDLSLPQERLSQDLVSKKYQMEYNSHGEVVIPDSKGWGFGDIILFG